MSLKKSVALLKETAKGFSSDGEEVRGVASAEKNGKAAVISLSLIRLAPLKGGNYEFIYFGESGVERSILKDLSGGEFKVSDPAAAGGVAVAAAAERKIVAFGRFPSSDITLKEAESLAFPSAEEQPLKEAESAGRKASAESPVYDDEAVATENYYEFSENYGKKETDEESEYGKESVFAGDEDNGAYGRDSGGEKEEEPYIESGNFQTGDGSFPRGFYGTAKGKIDNLFGKFPEEKSLSRHVADSRWIKIDYEGDKYYVVGILSENGKPRYICYGVRGKYGEKPKELTDYCSFIPSSPFSPRGDGFWMMYQDTETGKKIF